MRYRELIRELLIALAEGKPSPSMIAELREIEESLSKDLPQGLEGRVYFRASEVLRDLRVELENSMKLTDLFMKAAYGVELSKLEERGREEVGEEKPPFKPFHNAFKLTLVTFKTRVPKFVGVDMRVYGPFSEGDLAFIPEENAEALKLRGAVEVVEDAGTS
ncbi:MAG: hypothetical protein RMI85_05050 [Candidatus Korarchaeum sp.]|nr:hypothetical protein [Candidatus Korarchaeum sp.]